MTWKIGGTRCTEVCSVLAMKTSVMVSPSRSLPLSGAKGSRINSTNHLAAFCIGMQRHAVRCLPEHALSCAEGVSITWRFGAAWCATEYHFLKYVNNIHLPCTLYPIPCTLQPAWLKSAAPGSIPRRAGSAAGWSCPPDAATRR
jgi:hypothetical protein